LALNRHTTQHTSYVSVISRSYVRSTVSQILTYNQPCASVSMQFLRMRQIYILFQLVTLDLVNIMRETIELTEQTALALSSSDVCCWSQNSPTACSPIHPHKWYIVPYEYEIYDAGLANKTS